MLALPPLLNGLRNPKKMILDVKWQRKMVALKYKLNSNAHYIHSRLITAEVEAFRKNSVKKSFNYDCQAGVFGVFWVTFAGVDV